VRLPVSYTGAQIKQPQGSGELALIWSLGTGGPIIARKAMSPY